MLLNASSLTDCFSLLISLVVVSLLIKSIIRFKSFLILSEYFFRVSLLSIYSLVIFWKTLSFSTLLVLNNDFVFSLVIYLSLLFSCIKYSLSWIWTPKYNSAPLRVPGLRISTSNSGLPARSSPSQCMLTTMSWVGALSNPAHKSLLKVTSIYFDLFWFHHHILCLHQPYTWRMQHYQVFRISYIPCRSRFHLFCW